MRFSDGKRMRTRTRTCAAVALPSAIGLAVLLGALSGCVGSRDAKSSLESATGGERRLSALLSRVEPVEVHALLTDAPVRSAPLLIVTPEGLWLDASRALPAGAGHDVSRDGHPAIASTRPRVHLALPGLWASILAEQGPFGALVPTLHDLRVHTSAHDRRFTSRVRHPLRGVTQTHEASGDSSDVGGGPTCTDSMRAMGICGREALPRRFADNVLTVYVDRAASIHQLAAVIGEAQRAGYFYFDAVVATPNGPRIVTLSPSPARPLYPASDQRCSEVSVIVEANRLSLGVDQLGPGASRRPLYERATLGARDVRRRLSGILRAVPLGQRGCSRGLLRIGQDGGEVSWGTVAPALAAVWESIAVDTFQLATGPNGTGGVLAAPF